MRAIKADARTECPALSAHMRRDRGHTMTYVERVRRMREESLREERRGTTLAERCVRILPLVQASRHGRICTNGEAAYLHDRPEWCVAALYTYNLDGRGMQVVHVATRSPVGEAAARSVDAPPWRIHSISAAMAEGDAVRLAAERSQRRGARSLAAAAADVHIAPAVDAATAVPVLRLPAVL